MFRRFRYTLAVFGLLAVTSFTLSPAPDVSQNLDRVLRDWVERPTTATVRVLVQARPGTGRLMLERLRLATRRSVAPVCGDEMLVAELSSPALLAIAADRDVVRVTFGGLARSQ